MIIMDANQHTPSNYPVEETTNDLQLEDLAALSDLFNPALLSHELTQHFGLGEW